MISIFGNRKRKSKPDSNKLPLGKARVKEVRNIIDTVLKQVNCEVEWQESGVNQSVDFVFQTGNFRLYLSETSAFANLTYPLFFSTTMSNLSLVRSLCNQVNIESDLTKALYSLNEQKGEVEVHLVATLFLERTSAKAMLLTCMADCFQWHSAFVRKFETLEEEQKKRKTDDTEADKCDMDRELFLVRQQEMKRQHAREWRANATNGIALGQFLDKALSLNGILPVRLTLYADDTTQEWVDDIMDFNLAGVICPEDAPERKKAVLGLSYIDPALPGAEQWLTLQLNFEGDDKHTTWFRTTCCCTPPPNDNFHHRRLLHTVSVLMAFDRVSVKQWTDEFNYMWKDAADKVEKGDTDSLTEEQKMIWFISQPDLGKTLYRGHKLYLEERYYEAILYLENGYWYMQNEFDALTNQYRDALFEAGYIIGFCYLQLHQYIKAYYYLEITSHLHRVKYTQVFVNAAVNMGDFRALNIVEDLLSKMEERLQDEEEPEAFLLTFTAFLKRNKSYLLVEQNRLEEAKTMLNAMLNDPDNHDFAIGELAYIQKLEKKE